MSATRRRDGNKVQFKDGEALSEQRRAAERRARREQPAQPNETAENEIYYLEHTHANEGGGHQGESRPDNLPKVSSGSCQTEVTLQKALNYSLFWCPYSVITYSAPIKKAEEEEEEETWTSDLLIHYIFLSKESMI